MKEATIGFLRDIHPDATLKAYLREDLNILLQNVPLKPEELQILQSNTPVNDEDMEDDSNEVVIPAYDIVNNKIFFGNGKERITTKAIEIRCDPDDAIILKKLLTRISLSSRNQISFMPTGMLQISGQDIYKRSIGAHNSYLENFDTFPMCKLYLANMSLICSQLLESPYINRILKTKSSTTKGRWLIKTTKSKTQQAQKHCKTTLMQL